MLDIEAICHDKLSRLRPCTCGCRSFHLDDEMNWQCSRCKPPEAGAVRFELDDESQAAANQDGTRSDGRGDPSLQANSKEEATLLALQRLEQKIRELLSPVPAINATHHERLKDRAAAGNRSGRHEPVSLVESA
jgi:hypothetical protein